METINATEFKAKCLALLDRVARSGEPITILKRGRPVAQLRPAVTGGEEYPQRTLRGTVQVLGNIIDPVVSLEDWEAIGGRR